VNFKSKTSLLLIKFLLKVRQFNEGPLELFVLQKQVIIHLVWMGLKLVPV